MSRQASLLSSKSDTHSGELKLAIFAQQNKRILRDNKPFQISHYQKQDDLNILLNTAQSLKQHYFRVKLQPLDSSFSLPSGFLYVFLNYVYAELQPSDRAGAFRKSSFKFLKQLASTTNTATTQSRKETVHKIASNETEGLNHLLKLYVSSVKDADLPEDEILDSLTLLS